MITFSPGEMASSEQASHSVPLNSTRPFLPGRIMVSATAILPTNSSGSMLATVCPMPNLRFTQLRNSSTESTELTRKTISCVLMEMSKKKVAMATIQAPSPKKNKIKPGSRNSSKKSARPRPNQITALFKKLSILQLAYLVLKVPFFKGSFNSLYIP